MKITALATYFLSAPLPQPVRTSTSTISRVSELVVRLTTDAGLVGIGEAHGPFLSQGGPEGMRAVGQILERITLSSSVRTPSASSGSGRISSPSPTRACAGSRRWRSNAGSS